MTNRLAKKDIIISLIMLAFGAVLVYLATVDVINYTVACLIMGIACIVPFFVMFEHSRAKCQMIVLIATLSAIAIVGRWVFAWLPNVTISTGIVILAGVSLGGVPGFIVGSITMLVSNMLLGQGLWTVWQMLAMGLVGIFASLFRNSDKITLSVLGVFVGFAYGFIMDISTLVTVYNDITWNTFLVVWAASFYFDLAHAISTVVTVLLFYNVIVPTVRRKLTK